MKRIFYYQHSNLLFLNEKTVVRSKKTRKALPFEMIIALGNSNATDIN